MCKKCELIKMLAEDVLAIVDRIIDSYYDNGNAFSILKAKREMIFTIMHEPEEA